MANPRIDVEIGAKISQFQKAIADSQSSLNRFGKSATAFGKVLSLSVTAPILALGVASIKTFGQIEALQKGLIAVSKDADSASKEFTKLIQVAKLPGLGLEEAVRGSVALQSAGFSADEARESLLAFGNALATVGKGKAELNFVILALTQLQNKSTGFGQDLRQLVEQLPQLRQALTDAFGTAESEEIAKLGVTGREVVQSLVTEFQKLPQVSGGIKNAFENVSDSIQISFSVIGESINRIVGAEGLIDGLGEKIRNLANGFANLNPNTQKAILFTAGLAAAIGPLSLAIGSIISALPILTAGFAVLTGPIGLVAIAVGAAIPLLINLNDELNRTKLIAGQVKTDLLTQSLKENREEFERLSKQLEEGGLTKLEAQNKAIDALLLQELNLLRARKENNNIDFDGILARVKALNALKDQINEVTKATVNQTEGLGLIESLTSRINDLNANRIKASSVDEIVEIDKKIKALKEELSLLNAIAKRKASDDPNPVLPEPIEERKPDFGINLPKNIQGIFNAIPFEKFTEGLEGVKNNVIDTSNQIGNVFINLGSTIGSALTGASGSLAGFGSSLLKVIGGIAVQLGEAAIGIGASMLAIKFAFKNPFTAIAAGVALVALGSAISNVANNATSGIGSGGGVGSGVSGTSFQGQGATAFNGNREIFGELVVRGNDLVYVFDQSRDKIAKG